MQPRRALYLPGIAAALALVAVGIHGQGPPSCAPTMADDMTVLLSFSMQNAEGPLFGDIKCNGQECPTVPTTDYNATLILQRSFNTCAPNSAMIEFDDADLATFFTSVELNLSSASGDETATIDTSGSVSSVDGILPSQPGIGTISLYVVSDTYSRKPETDSEGNLGCAEDSNADGFGLVDTLLGTLPPFDNADLPIDPWSQRPLVCIYTCTIVIAVIELTELCDSPIPGMAQINVVVLPFLNFASSARSDPLCPVNLACNVASAALGPFVSPTTDFDDVAVNGEEAGPVCEAEGAQLGALVVEGECSECCTDPPCEFHLELEANDEEVEKTFDIGSLRVGSTVEVSLEKQMCKSVITMANLKSQINLYVWSSTYFRCAVFAPGADPMCPDDPDADIGPKLIPDGLANFFQGICPESSPGKIPVCLYVCLEARAIECLFPCQGDGGGSIGQIRTIEPVYDEEGFLQSKTISDPHFQGFRGQTYDFHGQPGKIYHILSEHPDFVSLDEPALSVNAHFGQAYATALSGDSSTGQMHSYAAKSGATWLTEVGVQYGSSCIVVGSKAGVVASASADFEIAHGSLQVDGTYMTRTGSYDFGGFNMSVENKKSFVHIALSGKALAMSLDIVSPPKSWDVDSSMIGDLTHININVDKILLRHGLGVMGLSSVRKNSELNSSMLAPREADFEMQELCSLPAADRIARLD